MSFREQDPLLPTERAGERGFFYGWVMAAAFFWMIVVIWGAYYSFGVFLKPLAQEFGWGRALTAGAAFISMILQGLTSVVAGALADRLGPRKVTAGAALVTGLGYLLMSQVSTWWHLYLFFGVMVGMGTSPIYVTASATIPRWFTEKRGLALGIVYAGVGVGQMIFPPLMTYLITGYGWRFAYIVMGLIVGCLTLAAVGLLRPLPQGREPAPTSPVNSPDPEKGARSAREAMRTSPFWFLFFAWFLVAIPLQILLVHIVAHATDRGIDPAAAAFILTLMGLTVTIARVTVGGISDRFGNKSTYYGCLFLQLAMMFWLMGSSQLWTFYVAAVIFGIGYGGAAIVYVKVVADLFGLKALGAIVGILSLSWYWGAGLGAPLAGYIFDISGSYTMAFLIGGIAVALALLFVHLVLKGPSPILRPREALK